MQVLKSFYCSVLAAGTYSIISPGWQLRTQHILSITSEDNALYADILDMVDDEIYQFVGAAPPLS